MLIFKSIAHTVSHLFIQVPFVTDLRGTYTVLSEYHNSLFYRANHLPIHNQFQVLLKAHLLLLKVNISVVHQTKPFVHSKYRREYLSGTKRALTG